MKISQRLILLCVLLASCNHKSHLSGSEPSGAMCVNGARPGVNENPCGTNGRLLDGKCVSASTRCDSIGCCPGMLCNGGGQCQIAQQRVKVCSTDADCSDGRHCLDQPRESTQKTCGFKPVAANGTCDAGEHPFDHRCITNAPCGGSCLSGQVCNIDLNLCEKPPLPPTATNACAQTCAGGTMLVYKDPDSMLFDSCCEVTCACETLPSIEPGSFGQYADTMVSGGQLYVSAYSSTYGDLVFASYDNNAAQTQLQFADGFPATGTVAGDPNSYRHGITDPGPNVGKYTSIATTPDNAVRIAYFDVDHKVLKYAAAGPDNTWVTSVIDDGRSLDTQNGDFASVGKYTSLAIDSQGFAHVSYLAHRLLVGGKTVSTPMYARARVLEPASYDDWEHVAIDPLPSCDGACHSGEVCTLVGNTPTCSVTSNACSSACACDKVCVSSATGSSCQPLLPNRLDGDACNDGCAALSDLTLGNGLFTSIAFLQGAPIVSYYDKTRGQLRAAIANFKTNDPVAPGFTVLPLSCDGGAHASMAVSGDGSHLAVAFMGDENILEVFTGSDFLHGEVDLVDDGARSDQIDLVGSYASPAFDSQGNLYIAYSDSTSNDLMFAYQQNLMWQHETLASDGASGAFAKLAIKDSTAFVSHYPRTRVGVQLSGAFKVIVKDLAALHH